MLGTYNWFGFARQRETRACASLRGCRITRRLRTWWNWTTQYATTCNCAPYDVCGLTIDDAQPGEGSDLVEPVQLSSTYVYLDEPCRSLIGEIQPATILFPYCVYNVIGCDVSSPISSSVLGRMTPHFKRYLRVLFSHNS
jgi:hypothetical protein